MSDITQQAESMMHYSKTRCAPVLLCSCVCVCVRERERGVGCVISMS
jgi:chemotaxis receptor (MCP) glutamine deamidase CheD